MDILAKKEHFMTIPWSEVGLPRSQWTCLLYKNGELAADIGVEVREEPTSIYTFSFENDGDDKTQWQLIVTADGNTFFTDTWGVRKNTIEQAMTEIRSRMDSEAGFFNTSVNKENK